MASLRAEPQANPITRTVAHRPGTHRCPAAGRRSGGPLTSLRPLSAKAPSTLPATVASCALVAEVGGQRSAGQPVHGPGGGASRAPAQYERCSPSGWGRRVVAYCVGPVGSGAKTSKTLVPPGMGCLRITETSVVSACFVFGVQAFVVTTVRRSGSQNRRRSIDFTAGMQTVRNWCSPYGKGQT